VRRHLDALRPSTHTSTHMSALIRARPALCAVGLRHHHDGACQ
jgi:hypothetical protein